MTKPDADCLRLLPDRRLGSLHRLRDLNHRCPRFRMGFVCRMSSLVHGLRAELFVFGMAFTPPLKGSMSLSSELVLSDSIEVVDLCSQVPHLRWTKGGFARSSTSTWTRFMRRWSNATIRPLKASLWRSAIRPDAESLLRRATRREVSEFARRCRRPSEVRRTRFCPAKVRRLPRSVQT